MNVSPVGDTTLLRQSENKGRVAVAAPSKPKPISEILEHVSLSTVEGRLDIEGHELTIRLFLPSIKQWKPELVMLLKGETVDGVGKCDCGSWLTGFPTFDGYVNRCCISCGAWHRCIQQNDGTRGVVQDKVSMGE